MESKNDAPRIIIQLVLGAVVYYIFTFKYKDELISSLSLQVYYQALVIIVILNGYVAKVIDSLRIKLIHLIMMVTSNKYKVKYYHLQKNMIIEKSQNKRLSEQAKKIIDDFSETDLEVESEIISLNKQINKLKKDI